MAEREGFEPSMGFLNPYSLSRGAPSATRPPLRKLVVSRNLSSRSSPAARRSTERVIPGILPSTPSGPSTLRFDVPIRSRRMGQPLGHLSEFRKRYFIRLRANLKQENAGDSPFRYAGGWSLFDSGLAGSDFNQRSSAGLPVPSERSFSIRWYISSRCT